MPGTPLPELPARALARSADAIPPLEARDLVVPLIDLTELRPTAGPASLGSLLTTAKEPDPRDPSCPSVAAVCVHLDLVSHARASLARGEAPKLACVAGGFPLGRVHDELKLNEVHYAVMEGADEVDIVIDRSLVLDGNSRLVTEYVAKAKDICASYDATLKVILETSDLHTPALVWDAAQAALEGGADFLKTSTGFSSYGATFEHASLLMMAALEHSEARGEPVGVKVSGGVRTVSNAYRYCVLADELGLPVQPGTFRIGASTLLERLVLHRHGQETSAGNSDY